MNLFTKTIQIATKRPEVLILPGIVMLLASLLNVFLPVVPLVVGIGGATGAGAFESTVAIIRFILTPSVIPYFLLGLVLICILCALVSGLVLSGYYKVANGALQGNERNKGPFISGIKQNFGKFFLITLVTTAFLMIHATFLLIGSVPAVIITRAATEGGAGLIMSALLVDIITVIVLFISLMFSRLYLFFWFPAAGNGYKEPYRTGRKLVEAGFWGLAGRLVLFDIAFIIYIYLTVIVSTALLKFLVGWLPGTVLVTMFMFFIIDRFNILSNRYPH